MNSSFKMKRAGTNPTFEKTSTVDPAKDQLNQIMTANFKKSIGRNLLVATFAKTRPIHLQEWFDATIKTNKNNYYINKGN